MVKNNQDNDFNDSKLINIISITINNIPTNNNHVSNKKYVDHELDKNTIVRLNDESNDRCLKVNIYNSTYNLQIYNKILLADTTIIKFPNNGDSLLANWSIFVMTEITMVIYKILYDQQKRALQHQNLVLLYRLL